MSQPVKLSDALVIDARLAGAILERSIAGQVEYWARLGRAVEEIIAGSHAMALCQSGSALPLSVCLESVDTPAGRHRVTEVLNARPFPHFEAVPGEQRLLVRVDADGRRTIGRFVNREFEVVKSTPSRG